MSEHKALINKGTIRIMEEGRLADSQKSKAYLCSPAFSKKMKCLHFLQLYDRTLYWHHCDSQIWVLYISCLK